MVARGAADDQQDKQVDPLELFFDLVFVFALTQVTARMADDLTAGGLLRGMLVLATIWWAWAAYAWLTNEVDGRRRGVRGAMVAAMAAMLIASLAIPGAFGHEAWVFAVAYLAVRLAHIGLFAAGTDHVDVQSAARALAPTAVGAPALLLLGAAAGGDAQVVLWAAALVVDYVGGGLRGIEGWRLSPGHFAERHGLIVIIALGESIVAIGVGAERTELDAAALTAAALGVAVCAALWWTYFDDDLPRVEHALQAAHAGGPRNRMARDTFSFLHLPLVAGIVLLALGIKKALNDTSHELELLPAIGLCGGPALYLLCDVAFRARCAVASGRVRPLAVIALLVAVPVAAAVPALVALAIVAGVCVVLVAAEERAAAIA